MPTITKFERPAITRARHLIFIAILVIAVCISANASEPCINVSIPALQSKSGTSLAVPVNVGNMTGLSARSADFTITYNDAVMDFTGATLGTVGTSNGGNRTVTLLESPSGTVAVSIFGASEFQGLGSLINLNFAVTGMPTAQTAVSFPSFMFNEGNPCDSTSNGSVTVISGSISGKVLYGNPFTGPTPRSVSGVTLDADGSLDKTVFTNSAGVYTLSGLDAGAYSVTPSKTGDLRGAIAGLDASDVALHAVGGTQLTGNRLKVADVSGALGVTSFDAAMIATFVANNFQSSEETGLAGKWKFEETGRTYSPNVLIDYPDQDYVALLMGDVTGNWGISQEEQNLTNPTQDSPLRIAAAKSSASAGTALVVTVTIGDTTGLGVRAYEFDLHYDPNVLEPGVNPAQIAGTVSESRVLTVNSTKKGVIRVVVFGAEALEGQGDLLKLRFTAVGAVDSSTVLRWENFRINEGGINFKAENGEVSLTALAESGAINGRLLDPNGRGLSRSKVTITDTKGNSRSAITSTLGYFHLSGLQVGETYTVRADARKYRFEPRSISIVAGNAVELEMVGLE